MSRRQAGQCAILLRILQTETFHQHIARFQGLRRRGIQIKCEKLALIVVQSASADEKNWSRWLGYFGQKRTVTPPSTIVLPKPECNADDAVQRLLGRHGIEVVGFRHSGKIGIETRPMLLPDHFLHDHRHLLFFQPVIGDLEVILRA